MIAEVKDLIRKSINFFGYTIEKKPVSGLSGYKNFPPESLRKKYFFNIGAGKFQHPYWTNIDYQTDYYSSAQKYPFINHDLISMKPLPVRSEVAELIYSSHTIEHISDSAACKLFEECHRILKLGGGLRLTTPDMELQYNAYLKGMTNHIHNNHSCSRHQLFLHSFASQLAEISIRHNSQRKYSDEEIINVFKTHSLSDAFNYFTCQCDFSSEYPGAHINWWTHDKLFSMLRDAGFTNIYRSGYGQSLFLPLRDTYLFDKTHPQISLYIEAIK